jgi:16S rRNA (guanine(527)-N(7))-methyltransferase RsmG
VSDAIAAVSALLRELGLPATLLSPLLAHAQAVVEDADRLGLVAERDLESVLARHVADSLLFALARSPEPGERWVDVGSGAGFPGLVLSCCFAETAFTLVEPQRRRAGFLELQCARIGIENAAVLVARSQDVEPGFDVGTARALAEPALALETLVRIAETAMVAAGQQAVRPPGTVEFDVRRLGVDSPGRIFMIAAQPGGA